MTTATRPRNPGAAVLGGTFLLTCAAAVVVILVAVLFGGEHAVTAAAVGSLATTVVMGFGSYVVHVVAGVVPGLSLLVALFTYALQLVMMVAFFAVLSRTGEFGDAVRTPWLVAGVATAVVAWTVAQVRLTSKARILLYDLPVDSGAQGPGESRSTDEEASQ